MKSPADLRWPLAGAALACLLAVAAALVAQHQFDMQPCPWCVLQRVLFLAAAAALTVAAFVRPGIWRRAASAFGLLFASFGGSSAVYQHFVASKSQSCGLSLADKVINALSLDILWPGAFEVRSSCADAAVDLLGVPFEFWSLGLFVVLCALSGYSAFGRTRT